MKVLSGVLAVIVIVITIIVGVGWIYPRATALSQLYVGYDNFYVLLSNKLNLPASWSAVGATVLSFVTAVAWIPLATLTVAVMWRGSPRYWVQLFAAWVVIYGLPPLLVGTLGSNCFGRDGTIQKWYVETPDRRIILYDAGGTDPRGYQRKPITQEICNRYTLQSASDQTKRITYTPEMRFYSGSGAVLVWYYRAGDGTITLYDGPGYHPTYGTPLEPIRSEIIEDLQKREAARVRSEAEKLRRESEIAYKEKLQSALENVRASGGASFDCARARTPIELLICSDVDLASLDRRLLEVFNEFVLEAGDANKQKFVDGHRLWLGARNAECKLSDFVLGSPESERSKNCLLYRINLRIVTLENEIKTLTENRPSIAIAPRNEAAQSPFRFPSFFPQQNIQQDTTAPQLRRPYDLQQ